MKLMKYIILSLMCVSLPGFGTVKASASEPAGKLELEKPVTIYVIKDGQVFMPGKDDLKTLRQTMRSLNPDYVDAPKYDGIHDYELKVVGKYTNGREFEVFYHAKYPWIRRNDKHVILTPELADKLFRIMEDTSNGQPIETEELVYELKSVTKPPKPVKQGAPWYPSDLRKKGIQGTVILGFIVNKEGRVANIKVLSSDHELFAEPAVDAVKYWRFEPAEMNGKPVACRVRIPIPFKIRNSKILEDTNNGQPIESEESVYELNSVTKPPKPVKQSAPKYPQDLRKKGIQGTVTLRFIVSKDGKVVNVTVLSSDHELFEEPAVDAVKKWRFEPAEKNGKPVACRVRIPIPFKIRR